MNDQPQTSDLASQAERTPSPSRCDNYERYLEDVYGYAYTARDIVSTASIERHDDLIDSPNPADLQLDEADLDDFERLGLARGRYQAGDLEGFAEELDRLLDSEDDHPAVTYTEIPLLAARILIDDGRFERADEFLDRAIERWPDHAIAARQFQALVALETDGPDAAQTLYERLADDHPDDPELRFELAEDLRAHDHPELARTWLQRAESTAERLGDQAILVDIRLLRERITAK